jgi:hypothetical protein
MLHAPSNGVGQDPWQMNQVSPTIQITEVSTGVTVKLLNQMSLFNIQQQSSHPHYQNPKQSIIT